MTENITLGRMYPYPAAPQAPLRKTGAPATPPSAAAGKSFQDFLQDKMVKLSHHAEMRLRQRGIQLKPEQMQKIEAAVDKAAAKGAKDSLLLMNNMALIVNVPNRTIVTAMDDASMKDNVFTQIDSAVVIS